MIKKLLTVTLLSSVFLVHADNKPSLDPTSLNIGNDYLYLYEKALDKKNKNKDIETMYLFGYVKGSTLILASIGYICPPNTASISSTAEAIAKYLVKNEKARTDRMDIIVPTSLSEAYPCKAQS